MKLITLDKNGHGFEQGSQTWKELRAGKFTGSEINKIMGKKGLCKTGESYVKKLIAEEHTLCFNDLNMKSMEWGKLYEPEARFLWSNNRNKKVEQIPFILSDEYDEIGCSVDGINFDEKFIIEIKCPYESVNHFDNLLIQSEAEFKELREDYYWQIQHNLFVTGYNLCYFISYDPRFKNNEMFEIAIRRNEQDIILLKERIYEALELKQKLIKQSKIKTL